MIDILSLTKVKKDHMSSTPSHHILCIGVAPASLAYILTRPEAARFSIVSCLEWAEAKEAISKGPYEIIFVYLKESQASLASFFQDLRAKDGPKALIAVICPHGLSEDTIRTLKAQFQVDYVIQDASFQNDIDAMFKEFAGANKQEASPPVSGKLAELKRKYVASIPDLIANIVDLVHAAQKNPDQIKELKALVHKIAGSAGSLGFHEATNLCKGLEVEIINRTSSGTHDNKEWLSSLDHFVTKIKDAFQLPELSKPELELSTNTVLKRTEPDLLYVVDDNVHFLELLERLKEDFAFSLHVDFDPLAALQKLKDPQFNPNAIICSEVFRSSDLKGLDLIKTLEKKNGEHPIKGLLIENDSLDTRLNALKQGCDYVFCKPVSAPVLLKLIGDLFQLKSTIPLKILIVDDDVNFCDYASAVLAEIGASSKAVNDPIELIKNLDEFKPDILLLDLMLPKYDGMNLLKTLRHDINYKNLIIIIITSSEQPETRINAYSENADYILFKPIDKNVLQQRILSIAKIRHINNDSSYQITGLNSRTELLDQLTNALRTSEAFPSHLVLFEQNHVEEWAKTFGPTATKDLAVYISNQLQWEADDRMKCYLYKSSIFAIIFEGLDKDFIEHKMFNFLNHLVQSEKKWNLAFNCSILPISKNFKDAPQLLQEAESALIEASQMQTANVKIAHRLPKGEEETQKEIIIVDPNPDLLLILKQAFESHGVRVKTFHEGKDALKEILSYGENQLPSLVIIERKLPDMDGMDLFLTLKHRLRSSIPVFMLTVFSSDKDIGDGIKQGVLEYIIKPFNISLLVQKALQVIYEKRSMAYH